MPCTSNKAEIKIKYDNIYDSSIQSDALLFKGLLILLSLFTHKFL